MENTMKERWRKLVIRGGTEEASIMASYLLKEGRKLDRLLQNVEERECPQGRKQIKDQLRQREKGREIHGQRELREGQVERLTVASPIVGTNLNVFIYMIFPLFYGEVDIYIYIYLVDGLFEEMTAREERHGCPFNPEQTHGTMEFGALDRRTPPRFGAYLSTRFGILRATLLSIEQVSRLRIWMAISQGKLARKRSKNGRKGVSIHGDNETRFTTGSYRNPIRVLLSDPRRLCTSLR